MAQRSSAIVKGFDQLIRDVTRVPSARAPRGGAGRRSSNNPDLEKFQQHEGCKLLSSLGAAIFVIGTRRSRGKPCPNCKTFVAEDQGTHQTEGIPDVFAILPARGGQPAIGLWWEAKHSDGGRTSKAQQEFSRLCQMASIAHCRGPLNALFAWLIAKGRIKAENVPHYRLPAGGRS